MKSIKAISIVLFILVLSQTSFSQRKLSGKVVEVIDGKTAVIEIAANRKLTVILQYIEIPEPEQSFRGTVKDHLEKILLGKNALFIPKGMTTASTVSQVFVDGVDVSQQMLRDGAAWYAMPEKSGQNAAESEIYRSNEAQAKTEKRGVWSDEKLKPAWEFRAEKEARRKAEEIALLEEIKRKAVAERMAKAKRTPTSGLLIEGDYNMDLWSSISQNGTIENGNFKGFGGIYSGTLPKHKIGYVVTAPNLIKSADKNPPKWMDFRAMHLYKQYQSKDPTINFMAMVSESDKHKFVRSNSLTIYADREKISLGKAVRFFRKNGEAVQELLLYKVSRNNLSKIAKAKDVSIKIGNYSAKMSGDYLESVKNLLSASE